MVLLSCSGTGGGIYAKLANEPARHNCARASPTTIQRPATAPIERLQNGQSNRIPSSESLASRSLRVIRSQKDILHKFSKRSRCAVLRRTRLLRSEDSCVDGLEHLDVHRGFLGRK